MSDEQIHDVARYLSAYSKEVVRAAIKAISFEWRDKRKEWESQVASMEADWEVVGSKPTRSDGTLDADELFKLVSKGKEWRIVGDQVQTRTPPARPIHIRREEEQPLADGTATTALMREDQQFLCPICGEALYPQQVCSACALGKAGIKKMWVCGESSEHVFFTQ